MNNRFVVRTRPRSKDSNQTTYWVFDLQHGGYIAGSNFSSQENAIEEAAYWDERQGYAEYDEELNEFKAIGDDGAGIRRFYVPLRA